MDGCIYRTKDGECDLYSEGGKFHAYCCNMDTCEGRKRSNYGRIISKSPEELAEWIYKVQDEDALRKENFLPPLSKSWWLDWLKQEATDES